MTASLLRHEFVDLIPDELEERKLYVSIPYATVVHKCCCGCGNEVVTPLSPTDWQIIFDGESISLSPSIGSWSLPCRSHYWISRNRVMWASMWTEAQISAGRAADRVAKMEFYAARSGYPAADRDQERRGIFLGRFVRRILAWVRR